MPDKNLTVIARDDDVTFGVLQSRMHSVWALRMGSSLEDRPRYTSSTCFDTFPFPAGMTPRDTATCAQVASQAAAEVASAVEELNAFRNTWLNPPEWVQWVQSEEEASAGFPERAEPLPGFEAALAKRTLTSLYNAKPSWLTHAHEKLDAAVALAYGWHDYSADMPDEELLRRLLTENVRRAQTA